MIRFAADWILPISSEPIRDSVVVVEDRRIVAIEPPGPADAKPAHGRTAVLPGLVNAHTHLELSYLHGRVPPASRFLDWIRPMLAARAARSIADETEVSTAAARAIRAARATGTVAFGDVSNTLITVEILQDAGMSAHVFHELIGFAGTGAVEQVAAARQRLDGTAGRGRVAFSLAPHAPYSVSPALLAAIVADRDAHAESPSTIHLGESPEEVQFLRTGTGPWRTLLEELGVWNPAWHAPGLSPVAYLDGLGFLDRGVLAVHCVQCRGDDLERLRQIGATVVSCPRSNIYVGVGPPPLESFYAAGVEVAFGTDSLASVADLNMFSELAEARRLAPGVAARALLRSATLVGARALGLSDRHGTIEPGMSAQLVAVRVPDGVIDVEEYLVSGVQPDRVSWLGDAPGGPFAQ